MNNKRKLIMNIFYFSIFVCNLQMGETTTKDPPNQSTFLKPKQLRHENEIKLEESTNKFR